MDFWNNFWNIIWLFFWSFAFIAYLFALFAIISDLFRDHKLNGWWKALWIIFLIFVPFLTALVYLIARGPGMAERSQKEARQVQQSTDAYIRQVATASPADEIAKAKALLDAGTITPAEFDHLKSVALGHQGAGAHAAPAAPSTPTPPPAAPTA
ncbi:SHOCT domain-containing protein [Leifsonia shinshuensis]|uniref:Signal transduction histidine kinase n=1 Tax=Leifsonia shinshuensis TaxID=150026 RepID=A0A853D1A8_9MICO|nr:SHOCT domain-containing protein [Leifsonia shinshuensis]NYJ24810.1 signal transduction histidine kinase [Leifsonia shinshuensis]